MVLTSPPSIPRPPSSSRKTRRSRSSASRTHAKVELFDVVAARTALQNAKLAAINKGELELSSSSSSSSSSSKNSTSKANKINLLLSEVPSDMKATLGVSPKSSSSSKFKVNIPLKVSQDTLNLFRRLLYLPESSLENYSVSHLKSLAELASWSGAAAIVSVIESAISSGLNSSNALKMWKWACSENTTQKSRPGQVPLNKVEEDSYRLVLELFPVIARSNQWESLSATDVLIILSDPALRVSSEDVVVDALSRWVSGGAGRRSSFFGAKANPNLLKAVRWDHVSDGTRQAILWSPDGSKLPLLEPHHPGYVDLVYSVTCTPALRAARGQAPDPMRLSYQNRVTQVTSTLSGSLGKAAIAAPPPVVAAPAIPIAPVVAVVPPPVTPPRARSVRASTSRSARRAASSSHRSSSGSKKRGAVPTLVQAPSRITRGLVGARGSLSAMIAPPRLEGADHFESMIMMRRGRDAICLRRGITEEFFC